MIRVNASNGGTVVIGGVAFPSGVTEISNKSFNKMREMLSKTMYGPDDDPNIKPEFGDWIPYGSEAWMRLYGRKNNEV